MLHIDVRTVRDWAAVGKVYGFKIGKRWYFHLSDILEFLRRCEEKGGLDLD